MIFLTTTPSLDTTHTIICKVSQSSSTYHSQIQPQRPEVFQWITKKSIDWQMYKNKTDAEYPFEHGDVIN
jgi:hypothetical protein